MSQPASSSRMPPFRIFLSHAGEDKETIARPLFKHLKQHGLTVFFDEESFDYGDHCPQVMLHAMQTAPVGVFILSAEFVAKEWPMRELLAFVRRYEHAVEHNETRPLLIPVFYRFRTDECRNPSIFDTYSAPFNQHGLYRRACNGTVHLEQVMHALDTAAKLWSIRNDVGATNSDKPGMSRTREAFIETIAKAILGKLGIESGISSQEVHPTVHTQSPQQDQYTSSNMVPQNPPRLTLNYDTLTTCEGQLMNTVLRKSESRVVAVLATGKGGVGKTCALRGLAEEREIKREFSGGILYMGLGNDATIRNVIEGIADIVKRTGGAKLAKSIATVKTVGEASQKASEWFGERRCLFLVDDIWHVNGIDSDVLDALGRMVGTKSRMVYTTRDKYFVHDATEWIEFKEKETHGELSRRMLMTHAGFDCDLVLEDKNEQAVKYFLTLCQGLPLGFGIIGQSVRKYSLDCRPREDGWSEFHNAVLSRHEDVMKTKAKSYGRIPKIVESSLVVLEKRSGHDKHGYWFRGLSVVQKQQSVPAEMLQKLWNLGSLEETKGVVKSFAELSVLEMRRKRGSMLVKLHDLILDVAIHQAVEKSETKSFYQTLVHNYMACGEGKQIDELHKCAMTAAHWEMCCGWWKFGDDGYMRNNVCRLLRNAGYVDQLLWLLSQPQWIVSRLVEDGILSVEQDLEHGRAVCRTTTSEHRDREEHLQMIGRAGRMSALFVNRNARVEEGWFQVHGRLQWHATQNKLTKEFVERMEKCAPRPWLKASGGLLRQAGNAGALVAEVTVSGMVMFTCEERDAIWIFSRDYMSEDMAVYVGKYDKENERYREVALQVDDFARVSFPRHQRVVTSHSDGRIRVWNATTGVCEKIMDYTADLWSRYFVNNVDHMNVSANGWYDHSIELHDTLSGELVAPVFRGHTDEVTCVAMSADGTRIVSSSRDKTVRVWDAHTGSAVGQPFRGHTSWVTCVAVSADGNRIVSGSDDCTVLVWDARFGDALALEGVLYPVTCVGMSADGTRIASGSWDYMVLVWDAHTGRAVGEPLKGHKDTVTCVSVNADGTRIVSGSNDYTVRVWDAHSGSAVERPFRGHTSWVTCMAVSADGTRIVSGLGDKTVRVWDAHTGRAVGQVLKGHMGDVNGVAVIADGTRIVSGSDDMTVRIWDAHTGNAVGQPLEGHTFFVSCVAVSADGSRIVSGSGDMTVRVWNAHTGRAVGQPLEGHTFFVSCVAVSADGTRIVSGSGDKTVRVWDAHTLSAVGQALKGHTGIVKCVGVSVDGSRIVSQDDEMLRLWALNRGVAECVLTSRDVAWQRTIKALELTWSATKMVHQQEVSEFGEDGCQIVLGSCEELVSNIGGGDVYFTKCMSSSCRIMR